MKSAAIEAAVKIISSFLTSYGFNATAQITHGSRVRVTRGSVKYSFTHKTFAEEVASVMGLEEYVGASITELRDAPSGKGPYASEWKDKPHRLLYDACNEIARLQLELLIAETKIEELNAELGKGEG